MQCVGSGGVDKRPQTETGQGVGDIVIKNHREKKSLSKIELRYSEREEMQAESTMQVDGAFC